jgi:hypothetical protein
MLASCVINAQEIAVTKRFPAYVVGTGEDKGETFWAEVFGK